MKKHTVQASILFVCELATFSVLAATPAEEPADLYAPGTILSVSISMAAEDWEALRQSSAPYPSFSAQLNMAGRHYPRVSVRKKGTEGSLSQDKPALKIRLEGGEQEATGGLSRLTLNNSRQDPALVRQCLAYWLYQRAGVMAPRCNFAEVAVNGKPLGLYVNVESIDKNFLLRHFASDRAALYEGNNTELAADWRKNLERKDGGEKDGEPIVRLIEASYLPEDELMAALGRLLDVDEFFRFWALTVIMCNTDSFHANGSNFYLAFDPRRKKFHFIPWGADEGFGPASPSATLHVAGPLLVRRLLAIPETRLRFETTIEAMLDRTWKEKEILAQVDFWAGPIRERLDPDQRGAFLEHLGVIREFVGSRRQALLEEMERLRPRPVPGMLMAERSTFFFAPFRPGRKETLCTRLLWPEKAQPGAIAFLPDPALRAWLASRGNRLCVAQIGRPGKEVYFVRVRVPGSPETYSPLRVVALQGVESGNAPAGR